MCTTDTAGTCRVTITSPVAGTATLHATYGAEVGEAGDGTQPAPPAPAPAATNPPQPTLTGGDELPRTGAGIAGQAWLAVSLLGAGTAIRFAARRRRNGLPAE